MESIPGTCPNAGPIQPGRMSNRQADLRVREETALTPRIGDRRIAQLPTAYRGRLPPRLCRTGPKAFLQLVAIVRRWKNMRSRISCDRLSGQLISLDKGCS